MINKGIHGEIPKSDNWTIDTAPRPEVVITKQKHKKRINFRRSKKTIHKSPGKNDRGDQAQPENIISFEEVKAKKEKNSKAKKISKVKKGQKAKANKVSVAEMKIPDKHKANVTEIAKDLEKVEARKLEKFKSTQGLGLASSIFMPVLGVPLTMLNYSENADAVKAMKRLQARSEELKAELRPRININEIKEDYKAYGDQLIERLEKGLFENFGETENPQIERVRIFADRFMYRENRKLIKEIKAAKDFKETIEVAVKIVSEKSIWDKIDGPLATKDGHSGLDAETYLLEILSSLDTSIYSPKVKIKRHIDGYQNTFPGELVGSSDTRTPERKEKDFLELVLNTVIEGLLLSNNDRTGRKYNEVHKINPEGALDLIINQFHKAKNALYRFFKWTTDDLDDKTKTKLKKAAHKASEALGLEDFRRGDQKVQNTIHNVFEASKNPESSRALRSQVVNTLADVMNGISGAAKKPKEVIVKAA